MTSHVGRHYQPTLWDALLARVCPHKLTLLTSSFGAKLSLAPKRESDLIWVYAKKFHLYHAISTIIF
jgi:hypothetical protein